MIHSIITEDHNGLLSLTFHDTAEGFTWDFVNAVGAYNFRKVKIEIF